jgi:hypothetical protein
MAVTPSRDTPVVTTQLRLLSGGELPQRVLRPRRATRVTRPASARVGRLDAHTREVGRSGVAEARRRLAQITATTERAGELVQAS